MDRAPADPENEVAIHQVIEKQSCMLEPSPLRGGRLHRPTRRDELSTRLPEPVNHRPRQYLFGHSHATALRHGRHGPGRSSAARLVRSVHHTRASSTLTVDPVELSTCSDCSTHLTRTKTESFTVRFRVIPCGACVAQSAMFRPSAFPASTITLRS